MHQLPLVVSLIAAARTALHDLGYAPGEKTISVKIRVHRDLTETVRFARALEGAGANFITVHGRTREEGTSVPVDLEAVRVVKGSVRVPVVANGDVWSLEEVRRTVERTGCDGIMAARAVLQDPGLFRGWYAGGGSAATGRGDGGGVGGAGREEGITWDVVERFLSSVVRAPIPYKLVVHHVSEMVGTDRRGGTGLGGKGTLLTKEERMGMMECGNMVELIDFLDEIREVRRL